MKTKATHHALNAIRKRPSSHLSPLEQVHGRLPELFVGDIILVRHKKGGWMRHFLRLVTRSYWDHVALIIFSRKANKGYSSVILIEAIQYGVSTKYKFGSEIHRLDKYTKDPSRFDIGIKRFDWMDEDMRDRVRAFVLMNIDSPYYPLSTSKFFLAWLSKTYRRFLLRRQRFSCSGFIQKAFYEAADWDDRSRVLFRNSGYTPIQLQDITSPADIAKSDACKWVWNKHL